MTGEKDEAARAVSTRAAATEPAAGRQLRASSLTEQFRHTGSNEAAATIGLGSLGLTRRRRI